MKYTRRLIIIPDAEIGPEVIESAQAKPSSGSSGRETAKFEAEATPSIIAPERGARYRQYQREQDGDLDIYGNPLDGTAVSEPVKKFSDDDIKVSSRRYTVGAQSTLEDKARTAHGEGDIVPTITGAPESASEFNLLVSSDGTPGTARFSFNTASESRGVTEGEGTSETFVQKQMPGDAQFRGSPLVFHKSSDLLISTDIIGTNEAANVERPNTSQLYVDTGGPLSEYVRTSLGYYCRPKLLPLDDGRLMAMYLDANAPVQHWALTGLVGSGFAQDNDPLKTIPMVQFASGKDAKWGVAKEVDPTDSIFYPASDPSTVFERPSSAFFLDAVQYKDTSEIVMVLGVNLVGHLDMDIFEPGDYPPMTPSGDVPEGSEASVPLKEVGASAIADDKYLCVLSSQDGGETWARKSLLSLRTWSNAQLDTSFECDVPGIELDDAGLILGGACELSESGRLLVTLCSAENIYLLSSDDRGSSFKAKKIKEIKVDPEIVEVAGHMDTPPPEGDLIDGQVFIPSRYSFVVTGVVDGANMEDFPSGTYIVNHDPAEGGGAEGGQPWVDHPNEIFDWDNTPNPVNDAPTATNWRTPPVGGTAYATGYLINPGPDAKEYEAQSLIWDSESNMWLRWDARAGWDGYTNEQPLIYSEGTKDVWDAPPSGGISVTKGSGWSPAEDQYGQWGSPLRGGITVRVTGGERFKGKLIERLPYLPDSSASDNSIWKVVDSAGILPQVKARDTLMSAGMTRTRTGEVCISVSYTDFRDLVAAPDFVGASLMFQLLGMDYFNRPKFQKLMNGDVRSGDFWINPSASYTARKTSVFVTREGASVIEQEAWKYRGGDLSTTNVTSGADTAGDIAIFGISGSPSSNEDQAVNFGPSCLESTVCIRPDGLPQVYGASHNWMPPEYIGPHQDRYFNGGQGPDPLFPGDKYPVCMGVMNVVAGKTFASTSASSSFANTGVFNTEYVDQINTTNAQHSSSGAGRNTQYDVQSNEISLGRDGTRFGDEFTAQDPRRIAGANPAHGGTSSYVPQGFIHPGAMKMYTPKGFTYTTALMWGLAPFVSKTEDPQQKNPGLGGKIGLRPSGNLNAAGGNVWGKLSLLHGPTSDPESYRQRFGFNYQPGTRFLNGTFDGQLIQGEIWTYLGGPRDPDNPNSWSKIPHGGVMYFDYSINDYVKFFDGPNQSHQWELALPGTGNMNIVEAPEYLNNADTGFFDNGDNMAKYYVGLTGGVTGIDAVEWRGCTFVISAHTSQYNERSYSWIDPNSRKTRSLYGGVKSVKDNSSIMVQRSGSWQPLRENLGRIDNAWDIGMGSDWANTHTIYYGSWYTSEQYMNLIDAPNALTNTDEVLYIIGSKMMNARNRLSRLMSGRFYQCTFNGQRDPEKLGWNFERNESTGTHGSILNRMWLIDASVPDTVVPADVSSSAPLSDVASEGGGCVLWRQANSGSLIYLGGFDRDGVGEAVDINEKGFLPFSEGRQCAPIADGMKTTQNGSALTGGFRAVFCPYASESYETTDFKVFFSLLLNNKKWLPSTDPTSAGAAPTPKMAGIIVSMGYDMINNEVIVEAFDGGDLFANQNVSSLGPSVRFPVPPAGSGLKWIELVAGFEESFAGAGSIVGPELANKYPRPTCFHAHVRQWDRDNDADWIGSFSTLVNYATKPTYDIPQASPYAGPGGTINFNQEHFVIGNMGAGIGNTHTNTADGGVVIKSVSLHRPGQQIKGRNEIPSNVIEPGSGGTSLILGGGMYDTRLFGTGFTVPNTRIVAEQDQVEGNWLSGDIRTDWGGIDPRYIVSESSSSNFYYGTPYFNTSAGSAALTENDSGVLNPTLPQLCLPVRSFIKDGMECEWRGEAQESSTFAVSSSHLFSAKNALSGPVTKPWKTGNGEPLYSLLPEWAGLGLAAQRIENIDAQTTTFKRKGRPNSYVIEDVEILMDSWGESGQASSKDYVNDIVFNLGTKKQFSPNGIAMFGKNFPAFDIEFSNTKEGLDGDSTERFKLSFGLPGDGRIESNSADWFSYEPDRYIHLWAWTADDFSAAGHSCSPLVSGGQGKFPYFGDRTFTYRTNIGDETVQEIQNIYAKNEAQEKATPWMPHQFKSSKNGPSFYIQVIAEAFAGQGDEACRFVFKIVDNTEDTLILDENPLKVLSQYSYDQNNPEGYTGTYRSWRNVSIFSDRMASEIVYYAITDASKSISQHDGFWNQQTPSLPGSGFRYCRITVKGCTRFGGEKSQRLGRLVMGRLLDLSGPDFEWGWSRSENSGVKVMTTRGGQRFAKSSHAPRRVFNVSHGVLEPTVDLNIDTDPNDPNLSNYFESPRRGFGSSFGPGWQKEKRKWEEVVALLRSLGPGLEEAALVFEGDSALDSKQPGSDTLSRTRVPTDPTSLCLVRLMSYGQMTHKGYVGREIRVPNGSQSDATGWTGTFGSTVCRPRPLIEVTAIQFEEDF